ncbi:DUF1592 domain-containing protein [Polyangium fumosum]|uniref:DUF1592 domain-containing protein n=2 Tax=Polyangium fumosum TaxID=889272 RepID=A0A4U1JEY1_9BACT|nr:DUF1592 domain-containing protein [Polyangium fumosum]
MAMLRTVLRSNSIRITGALALTAAFAGCLGGEDEKEGNGPGVVGCPDDLAFFQNNVYEPLLEKKCFVCHSATGMAGKSRLVLTPRSDPDALEKNLKVARALAVEQEGGLSVLLSRPSGQHPNGHPGGTLFEQGTPDYATLSLFVTRTTRGEGCAAPSAACTTVQPGPRVLRRLTRHEYDATISELFGIESQWGASFVPDIVIGGFDNNEDALRVSPLFADQVRRAAEEIATLALTNPSSILPCDPVAAGPEACAKTFVDTFGKRAFRRPLSAEDAKRYVTLYQTIADKEGFNEGIEAVITAMLQSPHFLYRTEIGDNSIASEGGRVRLTPHEIATELSYMLWGTMPDDELFAAADANALGTPEQIEAQAKRLLQDPRSDEILERFAIAWLELDRLDAAPKDSATYPEWNAEIRAAMIEETRQFVRHVIRNGEGTIAELLDAPYTFVSPKLATFYGLPAPAGAADENDFGMIELGDTGRAGILTHGSVLATHGKPAGSSPVHRGKLIRERLFCQPLPPPPPGVVAEPPPVDTTKSTRERYAAHTTVELCKSCHDLVDPIGFAFEHFDGIGRYRADENGLPIDASGEILSAPATTGSFVGVPELASVLADSADAQGCYARSWLRYAYGQLDEGRLACLSSQVADEFQKGNLRVLDLLVALTRTSHFTERVADPPEPGGPSNPSGTGGGGAGGDPTGSGGAGASGGGDPGPTLPYVVDTTVDSDWGSGYQLTIQVTNIGKESLTWSIPMQVEGTIANIWNASYTVANGTTHFVGAEHNATLAPGQATSFGFVANR